MVFFDIALGRYGDSTPLGRIEIELKKDVAPKTVSWLTDRKKKL